MDVDLVLKSACVTSDMRRTRPGVGVRLDRGRIAATNARWIGMCCRHELAPVWCVSVSIYLCDLSTLLFTIIISSKAARIRTTPKIVFFSTMIDFAEMTVLSYTADWCAFILSPPNKPLDQHTAINMFPLNIFTSWPPPPQPYPLRLDSLHPHSLPRNQPLVLARHSDRYKNRYPVLNSSGVFIFASQSETRGADACKSILQPLCVSQSHETTGTRELGVRHHYASQFAESEERPQWSFQHCSPHKMRIQTNFLLDKGSTHMISVSVRLMIEWVFSIACHGCVVLTTTPTSIHPTPQLQHAPEPAPHKTDDKTHDSQRSEVTPADYESSI